MRNIFILFNFSFEKKTERMRNDRIPVQSTRIEPTCHTYLYYFKRGIKCIECGARIKYIFHVCKKYRKPSSNTWICMSKESKGNVKELGSSVIRRNWEKYFSQGHLYEYTDTNDRLSGDIKYFDEYYRKSSKRDIEIDAIMNTFKQRTLNEDPTLWNPVIM